VPVSEEVLDLAEDPRAPLGGTTDHDRVGSRVLEHVLRLFRRVDIAVGDHRNARPERFTSRIVSYSASPWYMHARVRPCIARDWMP
jgi:hypothetical protein